MHRRAASPYYQQWCETALRSTRSASGIRCARGRKSSAPGASRPDTCHTVHSLQSAAAAPPAAAAAASCRRWNRSKLIHVAGARARLAQKLVHSVHTLQTCVCVCCFVCQLNFRFVLVESALVAMTCHDSIMWPRCVHGVCASLTALGWYEVPWLPSYHMCKTLLGVPTPTPCVSSSNIRSVETV